MKTKCSIIMIVAALAFATPAFSQGKGNGGCNQPRGTCEKECDDQGCKDQGPGQGFGQGQGQGQGFRKGKGQGAGDGQGGVQQDRQRKRDGSGSGRGRNRQGT